ncbi:MAG: SpoIIE family protein phosphatase, partial [Clostridiales bacterium]
STCLTQHLGIFKEELQIEPHIQKFDLQKGDIFLMCSDGITDYLDENELKDILFQNRSIKKAVKIIIEEVYQCGANDNLTIIIYRIY